jgi:hypothetical protein
MSRSRKLTAIALSLAAVAAAPSGASAAVQTVSDPVGDTPYPSLDIVSTSIRSDARFIYVTTRTAARLSNTERFLPVVTIGVRGADGVFTDLYGVVRGGVFDSQLGIPDVFITGVKIRRGWSNSITYRFPRSAIKNLSPFTWVVGTIAANGMSTDFSTLATFTP